MIGNCHIFANSLWLATDIWKFPSGFSLTLLAVLSGCRTAFQSISQQLLGKTWQLTSLSLKG
jgi:hypothetical protein